MEGEETALYVLVTQKKKWILTKQVVRYPYGIHDLFFVFLRSTTLQIFPFFWIDFSATINCHMISNAPTR